MKTFVEELEDLNFHPSYFYINSSEFMGEDLNEFTYEMTNEKFDRVVDEVRTKFGSFEVLKDEDTDSNRVSIVLYFPSINKYIKTETYFSPYSNDDGFINMDAPFWKEVEPKIITKTTYV